MNKEKLDALLANGSISQEEYDQMSAMLGGNDNVQNQEGQEEKQAQEKIDFTKEALKKLIQSEVDKVRTKYSNEKANLQKELDKLKKEKLTEEEIKQLEITEKEKTLAERERALLEKENRLYAIKAIKTAGLDDGSDISLELIDFVMADSEEEIATKVKAFGNLVKKFVTAEVDKRFKANGRTPSGGSTSSGNNNPFSKEHFNLTQQMQLFRDNPELANQLQAQAAK